jgi:DNA-binding response OmpR family regulator
MPSKLLFVDDEPTIRTTLSAILEQNGFQVTVASTVAEGLSCIMAEKYDILISDLNIGEPGDGFTVVSAMRRTQPNAVTIILTGFPAFESALRAIREQVDDFITKPADLDELMTTLRARLERRQKREPVVSRRLRQIILENKHNIVEDWFHAVEEVPEIRSVRLSRDQRIDHVPAILDELLRSQEPGKDLRIPGHGRESALAAAVEHGVRRRGQRYTVPMILEEGRILHRVISDYTRRNILSVDISFLISDLSELADQIHKLVQASVKAFLQIDHQPRAA